LEVKEMFQLIRRIVNEEEEREGDVCCPQNSNKEKERASYFIQVY